MHKIITNGGDDETSTMDDSTSNINTRDFDNDSIISAMNLKNNRFLSPSYNQQRVNRKSFGKQSIAHNQSPISFTSENREEKSLISNQHRLSNTINDDKNNEQHINWVNK